jgi:hypothetical protein
VGGLLVHAVDQMGLQMPTLGPEGLELLDKGRDRLRAE